MEATQTQLANTTIELEALKLRQQQLESRNALLEKMLLLHRTSDDAEDSMVICVHSTVIAHVTSMMHCPITLCNNATKTHGQETSQQPAVISYLQTRFTPPVYDAHETTIIANDPAMVITVGGRTQCLTLSQISRLPLAGATSLSSLWTVGCSACALCMLCLWSAQTAIQSLFFDCNVSLQHAE